MAADRDERAAASGSILVVQGLTVVYRIGSQSLHAVRGANLSIGPGEAVGLVGESGSGKSTLAYAILGALEANGAVTSGRIEFRGRDLLQLPPGELQQLRGSRIALVPQDPASALNPTIRVGEQVAEVIRAHRDVSPDQAWRRAIELFGEVRLPTPERLARRYPHQLSGGQQQRVAIAMAFACEPALLIMDEPTTGLDVTTEARILDLLDGLLRDTGTAVLYITHNLGVVARFCHRITVMYAGTVLESGPVKAVLREPGHPYTHALLGCMPALGHRKTRDRLSSIPGGLPDLTNPPKGCVFAERCWMADARCLEEAPPDRISPWRARAACWYAGKAVTAPRASGPVSPSSAARVGGDRDVALRIADLRCSYSAASSLVDIVLRRPTVSVRAVSDVSLSIDRGRTLALVGESGSGKTTLARAVAGLVRPDAGTIALNGKVLAGTVEKRDASEKRAIQMVFQNPDMSLNPQHTIGYAVARPIALHQRAASKRRGRAAAGDLLEAVHLPTSVADRYPHELSGGQKQRVAIARAFAATPELLICDEPLSALDASVQATVVNLLVELQNETGCSYLFISHDLSLVLYLADQIAIIYGGAVCELGSSDDILAPPYHPYTEALLSAVPLTDPEILQRRVRLRDGTQDPSSGRHGCPLEARCPRKLGPICEIEAPPFREAAPGHRIACHRTLDELSAEGPVIECAATPATAAGANP